MTTEQRNIERRNTEQTLTTYKINTGLMFVIVMQMFGMVWWVANYTAKADERLKVLESQQQATKDVPEQLAILKQQLINISETQKDIRDDFRTGSRTMRYQGTLK